MIRSLMLAASLIAAPVTAFAMPAIGDIVGTTPTDAATALQRPVATSRALRPRLA
nr:hypothetical protein [Marinicella sp. W31]MDC2876393.1 hypothetical protein [Marinicella sp. W31]